MKAYTAVFIGHRDYDHSKDDYLRDTILTLIRQGYCRFLSGGMGEFDLACEECVLQMKALYPHIRLCLVPTAPVKPSDADRYDELIFPGMLKPGITSASIPLRNQLMIKSASAAVCGVDHSSGGAYSSFKTAVKEGLIIHFV